MKHILDLLFWIKHKREFNKEHIKNKPIILLVGMVNSIHFARFVEKNCISSKEKTFVIINSTPFSVPHPTIENALRDNKIYYFYHKRYLIDISVLRANTKISRIINKVFGKKLEKSYLGGFEKRNFENFLDRGLNIKIIHLFEMQHAGYLFLEFANKFNKELKVYYTNYGSDIAYFNQFPKHRSKIEDLISFVDLYFAECNRDIKIAKNLGYNGEFAPINMNSEINLELHLSKSDDYVKTSQRKIISIKSYDSFVGRSNLILDAILECSEILKDFKIVFFSSSYYFNNVIAAPQLMDHEIEFEIFNHGTLTEVDMIKLFKQSRLIISNSKCDGVSTSIIEAVIQGAFPITSNTGCAEDWINLTSDNLFAWDSKEKLKQNIIKAITNDKLVDDFSERQIPTLIHNIKSRSKIFQSLSIYHLYNVENSSVV